MIRIGYGDVGIFDKKKSRSIWEVKGSVIFKGQTNIGHGSKIVVGEVGRLTVGERFTITAETTIICYSEIDFGDDCLLSWDILIMDTDFHKIYSCVNKERINEDKRIRIGDKCWIGCRTLILKGVKIPSMTIVAANSMLVDTKDIELKTNSILGGNPLRIIKENIFWEK